MALIQTKWYEIFIQLPDQQNQANQQLKAYLRYVVKSQEHFKL